MCRFLKFIPTLEPLWDLYKYQSFGIDLVTLVNITLNLSFVLIICITQGRTSKINVTERVTDDFLKYTYNRLKEIDSKQMCVEPWPPKKSVSSDGTKLVNGKCNFLKYKTASNVRPTMADSGRHFLFKDIIILYKVLSIFVVKSQLN